MMEGFGVHTFRLVNARANPPSSSSTGSPKLGVQSLVWDEAVKIAGADPTSTAATCAEAIEAGDFPEWELGVQLFTEEAGRQLRGLRRARPDQADPEELVPVQRGRPHGARPQPRQLLRRDRAGRLLHRRTSCPASTSPTTRCCRDAVLLPRHAAQRLGGPNFHQLPINAPVPGAQQPARRVKEQFRHCKSILVLGAAPALLAAAGIEAPSDAGFIDAAADGLATQDAIAAFTKAVGRHKHYEREKEPSPV
jgi:hypothetical protein